MLKNVLTLGPESNTDEIIIRLLRVADRFRLNSSHMNIDELTRWLKKLGGIFIKQGCLVPVVIDLQAAKMRIGKYPEVVELGGEVKICYSSTSSEPSVIPVPHKEFFKQLRPGDIVTLNDAKIELKVLHVANLDAKTIVIKSGPVSSFKGVNRKNHPIDYKEISERDLSFISVAKKHDFTEFAFSFVLNAADEKILRPQIDGHRLIAKIERVDTFCDLDSIDKAFDEMWLCRGDLGAQAGVEKLPKLQKDFSEKVCRFNTDCYLAGGVLGSMLKSNKPSDSEVNTLDEIEKYGYKGFVLSDETAVGNNIESVISFLEEKRR